MNTVKVLCVLGALFQVAAGANIFVYMVMGSYSHRVSLWPLLEDLAEAGHTITVLSAYENKNPDPKIKEVVAKEWKKVLDAGDWNGLLDYYRMRQRGGGGTLKEYWQVMGFSQMACEKLFEDDHFIEWARNYERPDLVILDVAHNECAYVLVHHWRSKLIIYSTFTMFPFYYDQFGLPDETSSIPDVIFGFPPGKRMNFWQRFANAMSGPVWNAIREWYQIPRLEATCKEGLKKITGKDVQLPSISEIAKNVSLVFVTSHPSMSFQRSLPTNMVPVGGIVAKNEKAEPISKDIQDFIADKDFIYVSLGSVTEFTLMPQATQEAFINAINAFPNIRFIWMVHQDVKAKIPLKHVKFVNWAPQKSLLAHPRIKGFITHAGMGSTTEAVVFGVPVVMFPYFADQDNNAAFLENSGGGIRMEITELKQSEMENAIREIMVNPKYHQAMKRLSTFFHDQPMTAQQSALWWTEFVLRHDNVHEYLRSPSVEQNWWVRRQLDVWFVAFAIIVFVIVYPFYILISIIREVFNLLFCKTSSDSDDSDNVTKKSKKYKTK